MYWAGLLSILSSLVNVGLVGLKQWDLSRPSVPVFPPLELEFASSYVGLERAYHDPSAPMPAPVTNAPTAIGVVNTAAPQTVYHDTHHLTTTFGTVYPDDRRILLSPTVSVGFYTFKPYSVNNVSAGNNLRAVLGRRLWDGTMLPRVQASNPPRCTCHA